MNEIRLAQARDAPAVVELMRRLFLQAYGHTADAENVARLLDRSYREDLQLLEITDQSMATLLVAEETSLSGYAQLRYRAAPPATIPGSRAAQLCRIYLDSRLHGTATARRLMDEIVRRAAGSGADAIWLTVWQQASRAIRFYEKSGFRKAGTTVFMVGDLATDDWVMWRPLATDDSGPSSGS